MIKKTIVYTNYNGAQRSRDLYFNLNKYELTQMMFGEDNVPFQDYLQRLLDTNDASEMIRLIKDILLMSYGERTPDGENFEKNDEIRHKFETSAMFPELYMELVRDQSEAMKFIWGILPSDMRPTQEQLDQVIANHEAGNDAPEVRNMIKEVSVLTDVTA